MGSAAGVCFGAPLVGWYRPLPPPRLPRIRSRRRRSHRGRRTRKENLKTGTKLICESSRTFKWYWYHSMVPPKIKKHTTHNAQLKQTQHTRRYAIRPKEVTCFTLGVRSASSLVAVVAYITAKSKNCLLRDPRSEIREWLRPRFFRRFFFPPVASSGGTSEISLCYGVRARMAYKTAKAKKKVPTRPVTLFCAFSFSTAWYLSLF